VGIAQLSSHGFAHSKAFKVELLRTDEVGKGGAGRIARGMSPTSGIDGVIVAHFTWLAEASSERQKFWEDLDLPWLGSCTSTVVQPRYGATWGDVGTAESVVFFPLAQLPSQSQEYTQHYCAPVSY